MSARPADLFVANLAAEIEDGHVVATGVASPLPILAIALAQKTHAPSLSYLACVGSLNPALPRMHRSSEDLAYLEGRVAEISIPDLFDHARRGRVDTVFFGAVEVDPLGRTNLSAAGTAEKPTTKFPGVAGACSLRRWCKHPVLTVPRQHRRTLVPEVQLASTRDDERVTPLWTDLGLFHVGPGGARLIAVQEGVTELLVRERTGFAFEVAADLRVLAAPSAHTLALLDSLDPDGLRHELVAGSPSLPSAANERQVAPHASRRAQEVR